MLLVENQTNRLCRTNILDDETSFEENFIYKNFNVMKTCEADEPENCFGNSNLVSSTKSYLLTNGIAIAFDTFNKEICPDTYSNIYIDVNGPKPPNKAGTDQFLLSVNGLGNVASTQTGLGEWLTDECKNANNDYNAAWMCAGSIQMNGWEIKY